MNQLKEQKIVMVSESGQTNIVTGFFLTREELKNVMNDCYYAGIKNKALPDLLPTSNQTKEK